MGGGSLSGGASEAVIADFEEIRRGDVAERESDEPIDLDKIVDRLL